MQLRERLVGSQLPSYSAVQAVGHGYRFLAGQPRGQQGYASGEDGGCRLASTDPLLHFLVPQVHFPLYLTVEVAPSPVENEVAVLRPVLDTGP